MKLLIYGFALTLLGCVSQGELKQEQQERAAARADALAAQEQVRIMTERQAKLECRTRYNTVTQACLTLYAGNKPGPELVAKIDHCIQVRGFPNGVDACG